MSTTAVPVIRSKSKPPPPLPAPRRKRGGQPGNTNARKDGAYSRIRPGPLSQTHLRIGQLQHSFLSGRQSPVKTYEQTVAELDRLQVLKKEPNLGILSTARAEMRLIKLMGSIMSAFIPLTLKTRALESIAQSSFELIERHMRDLGIDRDADSFFSVSKLSARNSGISPFPTAPLLDESALPSPNIPTQGGGSRSFATSLTNEQWAVLAPLIPPDPPLDWQSGQPPVIIAASRWGFTPYTDTGEFNDFVIMQEHDRIRDQFPALKISMPRLAKKRGRGRPRNQPISPRELLDGVLWKLATGRTWDQLPLEFPPSSKCRRFYRRLLLSGRLYTLLRALYNHWRYETLLTLPELLEQGLFTTTPSQHIALVPAAPPTWQNYTALLFMQLGREAYLHFERQHKQDDPHYTYKPVLKGGASLSIARLPESNRSESALPSSFQPLEQCPSAKKIKQIEKREKLIQAHIRSHAPQKSSTQKPVPQKPPSTSQWKPSNR